MSAILSRVLREPASLVALVVAVMAVLVGFGIVDLSAEQQGLVLGAVTALVAFLRFVVVPAAEVVVQDAPNGVVAGKAAPLPTGTLVDINLTPQVSESPVTFGQPGLSPDRDDQRGVTDTRLLLGAVVGALIVLVVLLVL